MVLISFGKGIENPVKRLHECCIMGSGKPAHALPFMLAFQNCLIMCLKEKTNSSNP